MLPIIAHI